MDTPFIGPSYSLSSRPASVQRTVNMMPIPLEPGNERAGWVFKDVPGLVVTDQNPPPVPSDLILLMHMDSEGPFIDEVGRTVTVEPGLGGTITLDTLAKVFGPSSAKFPEGQYLTVPNHVTRSNFGTEPWVVDVWVKDYNAGAHDGAVFSIATDASTPYDVMRLVTFAGGEQNNHFVYLSSSGSSWTTIMSWTSPLDIPEKLWHHIRFGRVNTTTLAAAHDGVIKTTATIDATTVYTGSLSGKTYIGNCLESVQSGGVFPWAGRIDELAMRKAPMNSTNFTVPVVPFVYP